MRIVTLCLAAALTFAAGEYSPAAPSRDDTAAALAKTVDFMMNTVATNGGFVWQYSADLSRQWGEVPARDSQIWVQGATCEFGHTLLKAWRATGDERYLAYARRVGDALVWGQYPAGGWHYFIDFDMPGIREYYDTVASRCLGWEEYYHYYGNCTFDDNTTAGATDYLLDLYMATLDPAYRTPLLKALDFILEAQYPNGGWPQRYPLRHEHVKQGLADYTSFYTFNDHVHRNNIHLLVKAWELLGDERYREAARRGMDFYIISQYHNDVQSGWGDQHGMDLKPAHARTYEPPSVNARTTLWNIQDLFYCYRVTGDRRYLMPIPSALDWLDRARIPSGPTDNYTHARYYELGTNTPLYSHVEGTDVDDFHTYIRDYPREGRPRGDMRINVDGLRRDYAELAAMTPEEARATYTPFRERPERHATVPPKTAEELISSMDGRGLWIGDITISNYDNPYAGKPLKSIKGFRIGTVITNLNRLIDYYAGQEQ